MHAPNAAIACLALTQLISDAVAIQCYQLTAYGRKYNASMAVMACNKCEYCAKSVSYFDPETAVIEHYCGCRAEFTCRSAGMYRYNSIIDEYAIAHCCDTDLCNDAEQYGSNVMLLIALCAACFLA